MKKELNRRTFLIGGPAAGLALGAGFYFATKSTKEIVHDIVILGGGLSGLSAGMTLSDRKVPFILIEASHRFGGRILTKTGLGDGDQWVELGGEFIGPDHKTMANLVKQLGLKLRPAFSNIYHSAQRKRVIKGKEYHYRNLVKDTSELIGKLDFDCERLFFQGRDYLHTRFARELDEMSAYDYLSFLGAESKIYRYLESKITSGYGLDLTELSALNLVIDEFQDFLDEEKNLCEEYRGVNRVEGGNTRLIQDMVGRILAQKKGKLLLSSNLKKISYHNGRYRLFVDQQGLMHSFLAKKII